MESVPELKMLPSKLSLVGKVSIADRTFPRGDTGRSDAREDLDSSAIVRTRMGAPVRTRKGKDSILEHEEFLPRVVPCKGSGDSFEDIGSISFSGASHPMEPVDEDLMRPVCVPIGQNKADSKCLAKSLSMKGPFIEDLSIQLPGFKPSPSALSPSESLVEEPNDIAATSPLFLVPRPSQNTDAFGMLLCLQVAM